jgi:hypothetical protein
MAFYLAFETGAMSSEICLGYERAGTWKGWNSAYETAMKSTVCSLDPSKALQSLGT